MKKLSKVLALAIAFCMIIASFSGCSKSTTTVESSTATPSATVAPDQSAESVAADTAEAMDAEPEEITFWHSYSEGEEKIFNDVVLTAFAIKYPNIKVNSIRMPYEGMDQQFVTAVSGDAAPDVMRMDLTWVAQMAKLGALEEVDTLDGFDTIKNDALESSMATNLYGGKYYGLPLNANTTVAVYNNSVLKELGFTEPPKTLEELLAAKAKTDPSNEKWLFAIQGTYNWAMLPMIWTLGGSLTDDTFTKASGYLNSEATIKALETIQGWYKDGTIGPAIMGEQPDGWGGLDGDNYSMIVEGPWYFSSEDKMDVRTPALIPSVDGRSISIIGGENVVMTQTSKHKEAAWTFMKFLLEEEQQLAMSKAGMIPTMKTSLDKVDTTDSPYVAVYIEQLKTANPRTPSAEWPTIEETLNQAFESVMREQKSAKDALDEAAAAIDALLAE